jgi:hypothetical protein
MAPASPVQGAINKVLLIDPKHSSAEDVLPTLKAARLGDAGETVPASKTLHSAV